jgi:hypothetical protein
MIRPIPSSAPVLIRSSPNVYYVHMQVAGASTVRIGSSKAELLQSYADLPQGQSIPASAGIQRFFWRGELWMIADGGDALVDLQFA